MKRASGLRDTRYLAMFRGDSEATRRLTSRIHSPSLWEEVALLLNRRGLPADTEEAQRHAVVRIYKENGFHDLRLLCEALIEYDETFSLWRAHHIRMVERMIGEKTGTGEALLGSTFGKGYLGSMGVEYLRQTLGRKFFPILWAARTDM